MNILFVVPGPTLLLSDGLPAGLRSIVEPTGLFAGGSLSELLKARMKDFRMAMRKSADDATVGLVVKELGTSGVCLERIHHYSQFCSKE